MRNSLGLSPVPLGLFARGIRTMPLEVENLPEAIRQVKRNLRRALPNYAEVFRDAEVELRRKVARIVREREAGETVIPIVPYSEIERGAVSLEALAKVKDRGACIIRGVFAPEQARAWDDEIGGYVEENGLNK